MRLLPLVFVLAGCPIGNDKYPKPADLTPSWLVDRTRVLAMTGDPPDIAPGASANFRSLIPNPLDEDLVTVWLACEVEGDGTGFGCPIPEFDIEDPDIPSLIEQGVIGVEPGFPPTYTAPLDYLDDLTPDEAATGRYVLIQTATFPADLEPGPELDFNAVEVAYKRLVVSSSETPNNNPEIATFRVEGSLLPPQDVAILAADAPYELSVDLEDDAVEEYVYINSDGEREDRIEEPYSVWYATDGSIAAPTSLYPYLKTTWRSPASGTSGSWWVVIRDRRGGMGWVERQWRVE